MLIFFFNVSNFSFVFVPKRCDGKDKLCTSFHANRRGRISRGCVLFTTRRFSPNRNNDAAAPQIRIHVVHLHIVKVLRWVFIYPN